jgi:[acyl-carrier-protein] S-malonyltransferase
VTTADTVLLFPGQGAYAPGVLRLLAGEVPAVRDLLSRIDLVAREYGVVPVSALLLDQDAPGLDLLLAAHPDALQLAIYATSVVVHDVLARELGICAQVMLGHSLGELAALVAGGAYTAEDGARILCERDLLLREAPPPPGGLMAIAASEERSVVILEAIGDPGLEIAAVNSPRQTVIAGPDASLDALENVVASARTPKKRLPSPWLFHHSSLAGTAAELLRRVRGTPARTTDRVVYSPLHSRFYGDGGDIPAMMVMHVVAPVRFLEAVGELRRHGTRRFVDCGFGAVLTRIVRACDRAAGCVTPLPRTMTVSELAALFSSQQEGVRW